MFPRLRTEFLNYLNKIMSKIKNLKIRIFKGTHTDAAFGGWCEALGAKLAFEGASHQKI